MAPKKYKIQNAIKKKKTGLAGFEPATRGLGGLKKVAARAFVKAPFSCSTILSYSPIFNRKNYFPTCAANAFATTYFLYINTHIKQEWLEKLLSWNPNHM